MKIRLNSFEVKRYTQKLIDKFKDKDNLLKHARFDKSAHTRGFFIIERKTDKLIGYIAYEDKMIIALEVMKEFQGKGYAKKLLNYAVQAGATRLTVKKTNKEAIAIYKHLGWIRYKSSPKMFFMKYIGTRLD